MPMTQFSDEFGGSLGGRMNVTPMAFSKPMIRSLFRLACDVTDRNQV